METEIIPKGLKPEEKKVDGRSLRWKKFHDGDEYPPHSEITPDEVRRFRESQNWYQRHLANRTGYSEKSIKYIELGTQPITKFFNAVMGLLQEISDLEEENARLRDELTAVRGYERDRDALLP